MAEPSAVAERIDEVAPDVWTWSVHDDRIDFVSTAYAVSADGKTTLVDPLPLAEQPLSRLGAVTAICLTSGSHQRSAWRLRSELGARVYAPALSKELEEEPDERYGDGDKLPSGLHAVFTPGVGTTQHTFLHEDSGVAILPDLLVQPPGAPVGFVPRQYIYDLDEARRSLEKLLAAEFSLLALTHGGLVSNDPQGAIRAALERGPAG